MVAEKFKILKQNIRNTPPCDLPKDQLYDVSFLMTEEQLKDYGELLCEKGIAHREYGHVYIEGKKLY